MDLSIMRESFKRNATKNKKEEFLKIARKQKRLA